MPSTTHVMNGFLSSGEDGLLAVRSDATLPNRSLTDGLQLLYIPTEESIRGRSPLHGEAWSVARFSPSPS